MLELAPRGYDEHTIPTEWVGALANATSAADVSTGRFGDLVMIPTGTDPKVSWDFQSTGGERALWAFYASQESRPVRIYLNEVLVATNAMWEPTGGWGEREQTSGFQVSVELEEGSNTIRIEGHGTIPHIRNIAICYPQHAQKMSADERFLAAKERSVANDENIRDLVSADFRMLDAFVTSMKSAGLTNTSLMSVAQKYLYTKAQSQQNIDRLNGFGGPFNGERLRLRIVNDLMDALPFSAFIETGAYFGTTTEHFARTGLPILSCEAILENFLVAASRLSGFTNVNLMLSDSRSFLKKTFQEQRELYKCPLFYLDAHWFDDLPLPAELNFIAENVGNYVAVVDDFEVPGSSYFYDRYSNGNELTFAYLVPKLERLDESVLLVPANASTEESGPRKGTLFVCPRDLYEQKLIHIQRLVEVDPTPWS